MSATMMAGSRGRAWIAPRLSGSFEDIDAGHVDVVVVYKVDRLSRSLLDFAKMMDRFNQAGVAFVSVTQSFSTADAMGRLTLNILMSFAEFEREMIRERTRDKIAGARRRGKWTGGRAPFGYRRWTKSLSSSAVRLRRCGSSTRCISKSARRSRWRAISMGPTGFRGDPRWKKRLLR